MTAKTYHVHVSHVRQITWEFHTDSGEGLCEFRSVVECLNPDTDERVLEGMGVRKVTDRSFYPALAGEWVS